MTEIAVLEARDAEVTETSWRPTRELSFEEWCEAGERLSHLARATQWWIGDWINYGADTYGSKYQQAITETGYDYGTLRNIGYVSRRFELSRRRDNLSWSHHASVASLDPPEQDALLDQADEDSLTVMKLRKALGGNGDGAKAKPDEGDPLTSIIVIGGRTLSFTFKNKNLKRRTEEALRAHAEDVGYE